MSTTPKKPHKHAAVMHAWADGATIEYRKDARKYWKPAGPLPSWGTNHEYRIKPEPAAPVYPETNMSDQDICDAVPSLDGRKWNPQQVVRPLFDGFRKMGNAAIRRAIDDGQVVRADKQLSEAEIVRYDEWMTRAHDKLHELGYEMRDDAWVKSDLAASVIIETKMHSRTIMEYVDSLINTKDAETVRQIVISIANLGIRCAISAGQVVRTDDPSHKAFDTRLDLAEKALLAAGYERADVVGNWRKSDVVNAEIDPDFQEVKAGENYRWMGHTAREWQELYEKAKEAHRREVAQVSSKYSIEVHEAAASVKAAQEKIAAVQSELSIYKLTEMQRNYQREAEKYDAADLIAERMKRAERALLNAGFVDNGAQEWKPPLNKAAVKLIDLGYQSINGEWKQIHPEFSPAHPIKPGETVYHESKVWQAVDKRDLALARAEELMAERDEQADRLVKQLAHAERVLKANGFTYSPDEGWSIHSGWRGQVAQERQERITYLEGELTAARRACEQYKAIAHRVGRAVAMHLNRSDITENQIAAIVLLERAK